MSNSNFHPKNRHKSRYDLDALCDIYTDLAPFVFLNSYDNKTIDFANSKAIKALNTALLKKYYGIHFWEFPDTNLCPPIPGRVDYIHHISDLLEESTIKENIKVLDIGTGASCIYPLLGNAEYHWTFVGTDIDEKSLQQAQNIIDRNNLKEVIFLRHQNDSSKIFEGVLNEVEKFSASICNPPFYKSEQDALAATTKKLVGLNGEVGDVARNFSGTHNELWYQGGEKAFIDKYIYESSLIKNQCSWFTMLVSKKDLVRGIKVSLKKLGAKEVRIINMRQGHKISRLAAWTYSN